MKGRFAKVTHTRTMETLPAPRATRVNGHSIESILGQIDKELWDVDPYDLLSRFAFLAAAGR